MPGRDAYVRKKMKKKNDNSFILTWRFFNQHHVCNTKIHNGTRSIGHLDHDYVRMPTNGLHKLIMIFFFFLKSIYVSFRNGFCL